MFSRDGAVVGSDDVVNHLRAFLPAPDEGGDVLTDAGQDVVVQIAVADVAEDRDAGAGMEAFDGGGRLVLEINADEAKELQQCLEGVTQG